MASKLFATPVYEFILNHEPRKVPSVVKSLSAEQIDGKILYTTQVNTELLDTRYPWLVQQVVVAKEDITVVFIRGKTFAFSLERDFLDKSVDWRKFISSDQKWTPHLLPDSMRISIKMYMDALRLDYGRLDFLLDAEGEYWFCEVNPNGQYAWLDLQNQHGLMNAIVEEISPVSPVFPLSHQRPTSSIILARAGEPQFT